MGVLLKSNNLYRTGYVVDFGTEKVFTRDKVTLQNKSASTYHTVIDGDRLDLIAYKYYSKKVADASKYWWVLADVNDIYDPMDITEYVGQQLVIPDILNVLLNL